MAGKIESVQEHLKDLPKVTTLLSTTKTLDREEQSQTHTGHPPAPPSLFSLFK